MIWQSIWSAGPQTCQRFVYHRNSAIAAKPSGDPGLMPAMAHAGSENVETAGPAGATSRLSVGLQRDCQRGDRRVRFRPPISSGQGTQPHLAPAGHCHRSCARSPFVVSSVRIQANATREESMPRLITTGRFTHDYVKGTLAAPEDREPAIRSLVESAGGKFVSLFFTTGASDFLLITEGEGEDPRRRRPGCRRGGNDFRHVHGESLDSGGIQGNCRKGVRYCRCLQGARPRLNLAVRKKNRSARSALHFCP